MKAFLRVLFIDFPLVLVFVIGHFLGYFRAETQPMGTYDDEGEDYPDH